ncbi:MAG: hypothetical protein IPM18_12950 [Phycisphaerales bacterium]|nr:hypothetical protein [Phycisphaerales bacterium]
MYTAALYVAAIAGLTIAGLLNGWFVCYDRDARHLPFLRRITRPGWEA